MKSDSFEAELQTWMSAAQKGDREAYRLLIEKIQPRLVQFFGHRVSASADAQELGQTTLLRMHMYRHTYNPKQAFEPWLFSIARNVLHDFFANRKKLGAISVPMEDADQTAGESSDPIAALGFTEAFEGLTEEQRILIRLLKIQGLSLEEAAAELGVSSGALKVRVHRACKRFQELLTSDPPSRSSSSPKPGSRRRSSGRK